MPASTATASPSDERHTPTPWRTEDANHAKLATVVIEKTLLANGSTAVCHCAGRDHAANAAFIVLAANSHHAMKEALEFYANPAVYKSHPHGPAFDNRDLSHVARAALSLDTKEI